MILSSFSKIKFTKKRIIISSIAFVLLLVSYILLFTNLIITDRERMLFDISRTRLFDEVYDMYSHKDAKHFELSMVIDDVSSDVDLINALKGLNLSIEGNASLHLNKATLEGKLNYNTFNLSEMGLYYKGTSFAIKVPGLLDRYLLLDLRDFIDKDSDLSEYFSKITGKSDYTFLDILIAVYRRTTVNKVSGKAYYDINGISTKCTQYDVHTNLGFMKFDFYAYVAKNHKAMVFVSKDNIYRCTIYNDGDGYSFILEGRINFLSSKTDLKINGYISITDTKSTSFDFPEGKYYNLMDMADNYQIIIKAVKKKVKENDLYQFIQNIRN